MGALYCTNIIAINGFFKHHFLDVWLRTFGFSAVAMSVSTPSPVAPEEAIAGPSVSHLVSSTHYSSDTAKDAPVLRKHLRVSSSDDESSPSQDLTQGASVDDQ